MNTNFLDGAPVSAVLTLQYLLDIGLQSPPSSSWSVSATVVKTEDINADVDGFSACLITATVVKTEETNANDEEFSGCLMFCDASSAIVGTDDGSTDVCSFSVCLMFSIISTVLDAVDANTDEGKLSVSIFCRTSIVAKDVDGTDADNAVFLATESIFKFFSSSFCLFS